MNAYTLAAAIIVAATASASARQWSLDSCVEYAVEHNIEVKQSILSARQGELDVTAAKDRFLPQLSGYASQSFNFGRGQIGRAHV